MRSVAVAAAVLALLAAVLVIEAVFDSALAAWVALGLVGAYVVLRLFGWLPGADLGDGGD